MSNFRKKRIVKNEEYFTAPDLAKRCYDLLTSKIDLNQFDLFLEPSAGAGVFLELMPKDRQLGLDINPQHPAVLQQDFLSWASPTSKKILVLGNPPFGQRGSLAMKFFKKCEEFSEVIAFILPRSFKRATFQNRISEKFHLIDSFDCDEFRTPTGEKLTIKCVFQIWVKRKESRKIIVYPKSHPDFEMQHCHFSLVSAKELAEVAQNHDLAIPQVGSNFRPRDPHSVNAGSYWFIRVKDQANLQYFQELDFSFLDNMHTAFPSLSKTDIVRAYVERKSRSVLTG